MPQRGQNQQRADPQQRIQLCRPETDPDQAGTGEGRAASFIIRCSKSPEGGQARKPSLQPSQSREPPPGRIDRGQHGGKGYGGMNAVGNRPIVDAGIIPVLHKLVQVFEKPPENGTEREQGGKKQRHLPHRAGAGPAGAQGVGHPDVGKPQGDEKIALKLADPGETGPGQKPGDSQGRQGKPAPRRMWRCAEVSPLPAGTAPGRRLRRRSGRPPRPAAADRRQRPATRRAGAPPGSSRAEVAKSAADDRQDTPISGAPMITR